MNMLLLHPQDMTAPNTAVVQGRRHEHVRDILNGKPGQMLRAGLVNGPRGTVEILRVENHQTQFRVILDDEPPPPPPVQVILAMVRPRIARQTLIALASLGVRRIMFINARRVAKPYFSQRLFDADQYKEFLHLGLEQGGETWMPEVTIHKSFKKFIDKEIATAVNNSARRYIAHPVNVECSFETPPPAPDTDTVLAIGPEGGWVDCEVEKFTEHGFRPLRLGNHILRVETAIPYAFGKLQLG